MAQEWHPKQELDLLGGSRPKGPKRAERVADAIKKELSIVLLQRIRDPKLRDVFISRVALSDDLRHAKIHVTVLQGPGESAQIIKHLDKAAGFIRSHLAKTLNMRYTPELRFLYDHGAQKVEEMEKLLADIAKQRDEREKDS